MKRNFFFIASGLVLAFVSATHAQRINVHGKITNSAGQAVNNVVVELIRQKLKDTTASDGMYSLTGAISAVLPSSRSTNMSLRNGVLQLTVTRSSSVRVEIIDAHGKQMKTVYLPNASSGTYRWNLADRSLSKQLMILKVSVGRDVRIFRYLPMEKVATPLNQAMVEYSSTGAMLAKVAAVVDTLKVTATGYLTRLVTLPTFDTTDNISLDSTNPKGLTLMKWADIAAKFTGGTFRLPSSSEVPTGGEFIYSSGVHAQLANGHLMVDAQNHIPPGSSELQGEIQLPAVLDGSAAQCTKWIDVTDSLLPVSWVPGSETDVVGGLLEIGSRLYFSKYQWYNGGGTDWPSFGYRDETANKALGLWQVSGVWAHNQRVAGYMSYAPTALSNAGYTLLAGQQGTSGTANGRWGPNFFAIQGNFPTSLKDSVASRPLLAHPDADREYPGWWLGDRVSSAVWIETKTQHAVLFFLTQQLGGQTWYGESVDTCTCTDCDPLITACGTSMTNPYPSNKGFQSAGYHLQAWIYDPAALYDVFNGKRDPWSVLPAEKVDLITRAPGSKNETVNSFITGIAKQQLQASYRNGRLIILQPDGFVPGPYESEPKGYVIQLE